MYQLPVCAADAPLMDVVFVHGIRGGAFATWRREGVLQHGQVGVVASPGLNQNTATWCMLKVVRGNLLQHKKAASQQLLSGFVAHLHTLFLTRFSLYSNFPAG